MKTERWVKYPISKRVESRPEWEAFFDEYEALCKKHNLSLGHEDQHGAFILAPYSEDNLGWAGRAVPCGLKQDLTPKPSTETLREFGLNCIKLWENGTLDTFEDDRMRHTVDAVLKGQ